MQITFENVVPIPLQGVVNPQSEIWQKNISFEPHKSYQIYSPSGKGKSSFLHIIYGLRQDYSGEIFLDSKNTKNISADEWANIRQQKFSIVFQDLRLFLDLTARENLLVKASLYPNISEKKLSEQADYLGVLHVLEKKAATLSYGERQRIAIIRALIQPFETLLLDEPFSHLDEGNIQKASDLIAQKAKEQNASILMTSLGYEYHLQFNEKKLLG
ncbi:MAG: ATP-binding cassette domain-containing protein [Thermonemataceae bacterium]|nr:ATP-binding cassette domain-containing protein [Thermonemataceae bacterium]